jgi:GGDEF domain-containing protein
MALTSIKRFLAKSEEEAAYRRVISMLLDGVSAHAMNLDRNSRQNFRKRMGEIRQSMASETTVLTLLVNAGAAVQAIGEFSRETDAVLRAQSSEMQEMIAMLARAVVDIGGVSGRAVARLRKMGDDIEHAADADDVSILKASLRECLAAIRTEAKQQEHESGQMAQELRQEVSRKQGLDPITELPGETAAQAQFLFAVGAGETKHVAVFVLGAARQINLRFGRAAGDDALCGLKQFLLRLLESSDRMFRWPGPAIVALIAGSEPIDQVRARFSRFLNKPIERTFDSDGRSELVPLSIAWSVFPLAIPLAVPSRQIHDFIAGQGYGDEDPVPA